MRSIAANSGAVHERAIDSAVNRQANFGERVGYAWAEAVYCADPDCPVEVTLLVGAGTGRLIIWVIQKSLTNDLQGDGLDLFERISAEAQRQFGSDRVITVVN
jgi:hypothetical protein